MPKTQRWLGWKHLQWAPHPLYNMEHFRRPQKALRREPPVILWAQTLLRAPGILQDGGGICLSIPLEPQNLRHTYTFRKTDPKVFTSVQMSLVALKCRKMLKLSFTGHVVSCSEDVQSRSLQTRAHQCLSWLPIEFCKCLPQREESHYKSK